MLTFNFNRVFKARGVERSFSYLCEQGYSPNFASRIKNNRGKQLKLDDLEKLCLLLRCTPNDLLEWKPAASLENPESHPLGALLRDKQLEQLNQLLHNLPLDKLEQVDAFIRREVQAGG